MPKYIDSMLPNSDDLLALEPEELAGFIIEHFNSLPQNEKDSIHPDNFVNPNSSPVNKYPRQSQESVARALMEAWEWLVREGLFARKPGSPGWYFITRRGERIKTAADLEAYRLGDQTKIKNDQNESPSTVPKNHDETLLKGRYRKIRSLTITGFSRTFLAEDVLLPSKRKCIIKQFAYSSNDPENAQMMLERFEREAVNLERLADDSNQVPDLYAHFSEDGKYYLVQEYIEGCTLREKVSRDGLLAESNVEILLSSLLQVLKCVHAHSLIHRDIKPENIVVRERDNLPFLIDFGAIKEIAQTIVDTFGNPTTTVKIGTPGYMSPEQAAGLPNFASDLYSLGLTAIFMLTGKRPEEIHNRQTGEIVWRDCAKNVSSRFAGILDKAIRWNFRERFSSAQEMLNALHSSEAETLKYEQVMSSSAPLRESFETAPFDTNMPRVATWWLKDFLGPVIELLNYVRKHFNNNSFELTARSLQDYSQVFDYRVDFFQRQKWEDLLSSDVGEYFLSKYRRIDNDLASFQIDMDNFDRSLTQLLKSIESSSMFLQKLIETYERLIQHERIPKSQYAHFGLEEISAHLLGQLHLQISNYRLESKNELVRFTAYALLGLNVEFPKNSLPEDHKISNFCRDISQGLQDQNPAINLALVETKNFLEKIKHRSSELWKQLRQDRMEIANRYNATFE